MPIVKAQIAQENRVELVVDSYSLADTESGSFMDWRFDVALTLVPTRTSCIFYAYYNPNEDPARYFHVYRNWLNQYTGGSWNTGEVIKFRLTRDEDDNWTAYINDVVVLEWHEKVSSPIAIWHQLCHSYSSNDTALSDASLAHFDNYYRYNLAGTEVYDQFYGTTFAPGWYVEEYHSATIDIDWWCDGAAWVQLGVKQANQDIYPYDIASSCMRDEGILPYPEPAEERPPALAVLYDTGPHNTFLLRNDADGIQQYRGHYDSDVADLITAVFTSDDTDVPISVLGNGGRKFVYFNRLVTPYVATTEVDGADIEPDGTGNWTMTELTNWDGYTILDVAPSLDAQVTYAALDKDGTSIYLSRCTDRNPGATTSWSTPTLIVDGLAGTAAARIQDYGSRLICYYQVGTGTVNALENYDDGTTSTWV